MLVKGGSCWRLKDFRKENRERRENTRKAAMPPMSNEQWAARRRAAFFV
jgi:hypothetical protein